MLEPHRRLSSRPGSRLLTAAGAALLAAACSGAPAPTESAATDDVPRLQGQVPLADQESGRSQQPYMWNMRLVGQQDIKNRGENGNLGWLDDCAYVAAYFGGKSELAGMAVIDASNPASPELVKIFPGTPGTRESQVEANEKRRMVIVMPFSHQATPYGDPPGPTQLQIYDASGDCREPVRVGTYDFGEVVTHEHRISTDGNTVWVTVSGPDRPGDALYAIDVTDMSKPTLITTWDLSQEPGMPTSGIHDLDVNDEGTRAYTNARWMVDGVRHQGLTILDTTEVTERRPNPVIRRISSFNWGPPENFGGTHSALLVKIRGRSYVVALDETMGEDAKAPWGWGRILDVTEERYPLQISTIKLQVAEEQYGPITDKDKAYYGAHYFGVDNPYEASLLFVSWYSSGLRVFDIRDPYTPKEIGYYIPGARLNTVLPPSDSYPNPNVDYVYSFIRYRPETGHIWFTSLFNGFQIVELVDNPLRQRSGGGE